MAEEVFGWLDAAGHDVFFDRDERRGIEIGEDWKRRLYHELHRVDAMVCLITKAYVASMWCNAEVAIADSRGCRMLPLRMEHGVSQKLLDRQQYTDFAADPDAARARLLNTAHRLDTHGRVEWRDGDNPYPGLKPFTPTLSRLFFGRAHEIRELAAHTRVDSGRRVVVVTGPSGCGKSSLLGAGLLPLMAEDPGWLCLDLWSPGDDPMLALARAVKLTAKGVDLPWTLPEVSRRLRDDGLRELAEELLADGSGPGGRRLLIPVDQGEELFTRTDPARRAELGGLLRAAIGGPVRVVITLRSEFLDDLSELAELGAGSIETYLLGPLGNDMLRLAIEEPARIAGLRLRPELVARLVEDTGSGEALPLLGYALQQLANGRSRGDTLTDGNYDALGALQGYGHLTGLHAVLASRADHALTTATERSGLTRQEVLSGLVRLVTLDDTGRRARRRVDTATLPASVRVAFGVFVNHRLLTTATEDQTQWIGLAHEALLTAWPPLDEAIKERGAALRTVRSIEQAAAEWVAARRNVAYLWDDDRLTATLVTLGLSQWAPDTPTVELDRDGQAFLEATRVHVEALRQRVRTRRNVVVVALSTLVVAALIAALIAVLQANTVKGERDAATVRGLVAQADAVRITDPQLALRLGLAANQLGARNETAASLVNTLTMNGYAATAKGHTSSVFTVVFSEDGRMMATGDGTDHTVRLWDVSDLARPRQLGEPLKDHTAWVTASAFSPDGHTLATASIAELILWDVSDPARPRKRHTLGPDADVSYKDGEIYNQDGQGIAFSPDGRVLASSNAKAITLWQIDNPAGPRRLNVPVRHDGRYSDVAFSPNGRVMATATAPEAGNSASVILWDIGDPVHPFKLGRPDLGDAGQITSVAFGKDGATLAIADEGSGASAGPVRLWDVHDPTHPSSLGEPLTGHTGPVRDVSFSPDGRTMATASEDSTVILWDVSAPSFPRRIGQPLTDHTNGVYEVAFSPDGLGMATASADNHVITWNTRNTVQPIPLGDPIANHGHGVSTVAVQPGDRLMITVSGDGPAWLWDIGDPTKPRLLWKLVHGKKVTSVAFSPNGRLLATGSDDKTVMLWNTAEPANVTRFPEPLKGHTGEVVTLAFAADGRTLRSAGSNVDLIYWDVSDTAHVRETAKGLIERQDFQSDIAFSPDGHTLVSGSGLFGGVAILRDIIELDYVERIGQLGDDTGQAFAFTRDGRVLATGGNKVILWDLTDPYQPRQFGGGLDTGESASALAFSPDGRTLAVGNFDSSVWLWNVADPARPHRVGEPITGHDKNGVNAVAFSADGRILASGGYDGKVILWDLSRLREVRGHVTELACERAVRSLSAEEWNRYVGPGYPYADTCPK